MEQLEIEDILPLIEHVPNEYKADVARLITKMIVNNTSKWSPKDFEDNYRLGEGRFGHVYSGTEKKTGFVVAIKKLSKNSVQNFCYEQSLAYEIDLHLFLRHENILRFYTWFHTRSFIHILMEFAVGGSLMEHLKMSPNNRLEESEVCLYMHQITKALCFCHQNSVVHRDLKPESVLISANNTVKLTNFRWTNQSTTKRDTLCGTLSYIPPEGLDEFDAGIGIDQWCLGVMAFELMAGTENPALKWNMIDFADNLPLEATNFIRGLIKKDVTERTALNDLQQHSWFTQKNDSVNQCQLIE